MPKRQRDMRRTPGTAIVLAAWLAAAALAGPAPLDEAAFRRHCERLTATPHRLSGTPEAERAAAYIESELRGLPGQVFQQRFTFPQQVVDVCELRTASGTVPLLTLHANGMQPSVTPRDGIEAPLVCVGRGAPEDLRGRDLRDAIVVADLTGEARGGAGMAGLFRRGAAAVIFVGDPQDHREDAQAVRSPVSVDLPRFYISRGDAEQAGLFRAERGRLVSHVRWEKRTGRNLFLWIEGRQPVFQTKGKPEFVILSAAYDTAGVVPYRSPGHEAAANCAALLCTAERLAKERPRRSVLVAFFDNHANFLQGGREFYKALRRAIPENLDDRLPRRVEFVSAESLYLNSMTRFLETADVMNAQDRPEFEPSLAMLRDEARFNYDDLRARLADTRLRIRGLRIEQEAAGPLGARLDGLARRLREEIVRLGPAAQMPAAALGPAQRALAAGVFERMAASPPQAWDAALGPVLEAAPPERGRMLGVMEELTAGRRRDLALRSARIERQDLPAARADEARMAEEYRLWQAVRERLRDRRQPDAAERPTFQGAVEAAARRMKRRLDELAEVSAQLDDAVRLVAPLRPCAPTFHAAYRFTAGGDRWLLAPIGGTHKKLYSDLVTKSQARLSPAERDDLRFVWECRTVWESGDPAEQRAYRLWATYEESAFADVFFIPACDLLTEQDDAPRGLMPEGTFGLEALDRVRTQASRFLHFLGLLVGADWASAPDRVTEQRYFYMDDYEWSDNEARGHQVRSMAYGSTASTRGEPNVLVHIQDRAANYPDHYALADANACFSLSPVISDRYYQVVIEAARFDEDGRIRSITALRPNGPQGSVQTGWDKAGFYTAKSRTGFYAVLNMFSGAQGRVLGRTFPFADAFESKAFQLLQGLSNSEYPRLHFRFDPRVGVGVWHVERPLGVKLAYLDPRNQDNVALYLGASEEQPLGTGYGPRGAGWQEAKPVTLDLYAGAAGDLHRLNESRLDALRRKNIVLNYYEDLHMQARTHLDRYREAGDLLRHDEAEAAAGRAAALERRVYLPVITTTKDMVTAVTILLLLTVPFAFALQSLALPSFNIYRRIAGFIVLFVLAFAVLYLTHPAFAFAPTPLIIFEAFFIITMSAAVIWIIAQKFTHEVKKLQGLATAAHTFEKSFFGNAAAAISLAISTMRRRPVRTGLTVVTVLLLTFTILSFVAFQSERGVNRFAKAGLEEDSCSRVLVRRKIWRTMTPSVLNEMRAYLGEDGAAHGIYWKVRDLKPDMLMEDLSLPIRHESGRRSSLGALMTLDEAEIRRIPGVRQALPPDGVEDFIAGQGVYLPAAVAKELDAAAGDRLMLMGREVRFLGSFDSLRLLQMRQIDGSPVLPVNFAMTKVAIGKFDFKGSAGAGDPQVELEAELAQLEAEALEPVSPDVVAIVPTALARPFGMDLKAVLAYPAEGRDIEKLAEDLAVLHEDGVYLNKGGEASFYHYGDRFGVAGAMDVVIPLVLGGLIVFSTMLGSVIDREKEIYTFSALGLAPRNIAMLFFVEAAIYAVIGGFGGYLFSQAVTRVLEVLARYEVFKAPEMNYSSSTAIYTILIVMATVIVSTIYPALQAARKATAETTRRWRIPAPRGDELRFDFPFTISRHDITGILCFVREHFLNHSDRTVGKFAAADARLSREPVHGMAALDATLWLQPFDQGISQRFAISAWPSDIEEVCEVRLLIRRLSGPPAAWARSNRAFLEDLRAQFLLWRTLDEDAREHYLTLADDVERSLATTPAAAGAS